MPGAFARIIYTVLRKFNRKAVKRAFVHTGNEAFNNLTGQKFKISKPSRNFRINLFYQKKTLCAGRLLIVGLLFLESLQQCVKFFSEYRFGNGPNLFINDLTIFEKQYGRDISYAILH